MTEFHIHYYYTPLFIFCIFCFKNNHIRLLDQKYFIADSKKKKKSFTELNKCLCFNKRFTTWDKIQPLNIFTENILFSLKILCYKKNEKNNSTIYVPMLATLTFGNILLVW